MSGDKTFGQDVQFLKQHVDAIVLKDESGKAQVAVVAEYQGRVMTSSAAGEDGTSFGWINYERVASDQVTPHINVFGGEERFWLGPEGGQFSIFFPPGAPFEFDDWKTPAVIDTEPFDVVEKSDRKASFRKETTLENYSKTKLRLRIDRSVELISATDAASSLGVELGNLAFVGYRTNNTVTNTGKEPWTKQSGLLSIWLLGMYKPGPQTTVVIPFNVGPEEKLGPIVNDTYFGKVPAERLKVADGVIYFSGDGQYRSKIGLTPQRAQDVCGSYDALRNVVTIVKYNKPGPEVTDYVNSMWELQEKPFAGDVVNAYNDGPPEPGAKPMGPFYELETSSPALALAPGESGVHVQETYHVQGDKAELDRVAREVFGVSLEEIASALK
ncbi:MAG: hypothetical protein DCC67_16670 [Planctomycetota bacterium]|nr:MAG: hypothetical protein DCC67_16670 [Planctomycetota bacterium]